MARRNKKGTIDEKIPDRSDVVEESFQDENEAKQQIDIRSGQAKELLEDEDKMERFLERLERKLDKIPVVGTSLASIPILISLVRSYIKKEYKDIPIGSVIAIVGGLIYFLSPVDLIPDTVPGVGYLDDAAVIACVLKLVRDDLEEYKEWQKENGKRIFDDSEPNAKTRKQANKKFKEQAM